MTRKINKFANILKKSTPARIFIAVITLIAITAIFTIAILQNFGLLLADSPPFPINLHSSKQANYSQDPSYMQIPPMELQLVIDAIWDENPNSQELLVRLTEVNENFIDNVASITPLPPTFTSLPSTHTPESIETGAPTNTFTFTPTATIPQPTNTNRPPTETNAPGAPAQTDPPPTSTPAATDTDVPASNTPLAPTSTDLPPTNTDIPPTNTPIPPTATTSPCSELSFSWYGRNSNRIGWNLTNSGDTVFEITSIYISWPADNEELERLSMDGETFWTGSRSPTSTTVSSGWSGDLRIRRVRAFDNDLLRFHFDETAQSSPYSVTITFSNGCSKSASH